MAEALNRGEYWPEASVRATMVREKTVAMTVIRLPEMAVSTDPAPAAPPEITVGRLSRNPCKSQSSGWVMLAKTTPPAVRRAGINQKLEFSLSHLEPALLPNSLIRTIRI